MASLKLLWMEQTLDFINKTFLMVDSAFLRCVHLELVSSRICVICFLSAPFDMIDYVGITPFMCSISMKTGVVQLDIVVKELYKRGEKKWPLVILHNKRVRELMVNPSSRELLEEWRANDALYTTPYGSNDDWYELSEAFILVPC